MDCRAKDEIVFLTVEPLHLDPERCFNNWGIVAGIAKEKDVQCSKKGVDMNGHKTWKE